MPVPLDVRIDRRAHVYRFGNRWHWKCGAGRDGAGRCLGGPASSQALAFARAWSHITRRHCALVVTIGSES